MQELSDLEMLRYNRQIILRGFDFDGQEKLKAGKVLVIGLGGLGCAATQYLAAAGVGHLTLVDFDTVSLSNLQRQVLHRDATIDIPKVDSAKTQLAAINPHIQIDTVNAQLDDVQLDELIAHHDVILDCTDNVAIREQLNRLCLPRKKPLVSGAAIRMEGQLSVFTYEESTPCYHCLSRLFGENNLTCVEAGVMSPLVGTIGTLEAMETIKLLANYGEVNSGKVLLFDAMTMDFRQFKLSKDPHCEVCAKG
ncbi:molybdopterin-synthase adenylyltransferase MoeB [Providencia huaxiensis]|uniref:molybdopterin-synthase adenylyltransferase MoeB n=1 Tax=Providencia huaxiensis TaxID=2027290 RepID=UPI0034E4477A